MADESFPEVRPGELLEGKYRIERVLGRGGMGVVVSAIHETLDDRVALKFLLPESRESIAEDGAARARFLREVRLAVKIRSEHVARVMDVGTLGSGAPYLVMEYLDGVDLARYLEAYGPLPIEDVVEYVLQACEALAEAHALGIVHRDLKPANLFRTERADGTPSIKLLDFGISQIALQQSSVEQPSMGGSPLYMAPEQMTSGALVDARSDVWALGVVLHELLAGETPFRGDTMPELCAHILAALPRSLRKSRPDAPVALEEVIASCLQKDPDQRYASVAELAWALRPFAPSRALLSVDRVSRVLRASSSSREPAGGAPSMRGTNATSTEQIVARACREQGAARTAVGAAPGVRTARRTWVAGGALLLLFACITLLFFYLR